MKKHWVNIEYNDCPECGGQLRAFTDCNEDNCVYDGDIVKCSNCNFESTMSVDEDGNAWVAWVTD